jgi:hypothetical protein
VGLLNQEEKRIFEKTRYLRYSIELLLWRTFGAIAKWLAQTLETMSLNAGYSRTNTRGTAASALIAAARADLAKAKL